MSLLPSIDYKHCHFDLTLFHLLMASPPLLYVLFEEITNNSNKTNQIGPNRQTPDSWWARQKECVQKEKKNCMNWLESLYMYTFIQKQNKRPLQYLYNLLMSLCVNVNINDFFPALQPPRSIAKPLLFPFNLQTKHLIQLRIMSWRRENKRCHQKWMKKYFINSNLDLSEL